MTARTPKTFSSRLRASATPGPESRRDHFPLRTEDLKVEILIRPLDTSTRLFIGSPLLYHRHSPFQFGLQLGLPSRIFIWDFHLGFPLGISIWDSRLVRSQVNNSMRNPVQKKNNNMLMRTQQIITI